MLLACLISAGNAASRYLFSASSNAWLEIQWQMFAGIFLLGAAQVFKLNEHVRVDLLYGSRSERGKLWTDVIGIPLFFFPAILFILYDAGRSSSRASGPAKLVERRRPDSLAGRRCCCPSA